MSHLNSQQEIKNLFGDIELKFPVDEWVVNGVHVWPYIRIKLYYHLLNVNEDNKTGTPGLSTEHVEVSTNINIFKKCAKFLKSYVSLKWFYLSLKPKEIIFVGSHFHRILNQNNLYYNKFFDPLIEKFNLHNRVYIFEFQKFYNNYFNQKAVVPLAKYLEAFKLLNKISSRFKKTKSSIQLEDYTNFKSYLDKHIPGGNAFYLTENHLDKWSKKIVGLKEFYSKILKKVRPEKIIFLSYYGFDDNYALIFVAKQLNIKTIDFQHGPQTNVHMAYVSWSKMPYHGFNIMPDEYWNWDVFSKSNIDSWAKYTDIKSKVAGHPYVAYCLKTYKTNRDQQIILFSMQTSPVDLFTDRFLELVRSTKYHWVFRLHPRNNVPMVELQAYLNEKDLQDIVTLQDSKSTPLPTVLLESVLHVTNYSGCVLEALMLSVPSIIIHNVGFEMFENYLDNNKVYYLDQKHDNFIEKFHSVLEVCLNKNKDIQRIEIPNPIDL
ncbi:hypothetical protein [Pseudotamlana agarivorans]|uniref:hypothetical protein n=1 Tax=Pseudotamlana agarivorans TaxID=481183 RepID=UPI000830FFAF|nr:hypothetical protein [Tamlana agarivorans]